MISGSSPRVRGKRMGNTSSKVGGRIIPASAGQTNHHAPTPSGEPDHPRECGANGAGRVPYRRGQGSSPRVRGKQSHQRDGAAPRRIIPASAGQTSLALWPAPIIADHPRECGANRLHALVGQALRRIIPASAGQTFLSVRMACPFADHPRECGANSSCRTSFLTAFGSSPRVRGKLDVGDEA